MVETSILLLPPPMDPGLLRRSRRQHNWRRHDTRLRSSPRGHLSPLSIPWWGLPPDWGGALAGVLLLHAGDGTTLNNILMKQIREKVVVLICCRWGQVDWTCGGGGGVKDGRESHLESRRSPPSLKTKSYNEQAKPCRSRGTAHTETQTETQTQSTNRRQLR